MNGPGTAVTAGPPACGWEEADGLRPPWACEEPALCTVTEACEHEHIDTARACGHHAVEVQMDGPGVCDRCLSGPGGHECPTVILITWDDPAAPPTIARVPVSDFSEDLDDDE